METQNTFAGGGRAGLPPATSSAASERLPADVREAHQQRIDEYETRGLANPQPFEAFLATVQADLFRVASYQEDGVEQAFTYSGANIESIRDAEPVVQNYLRISHHIARYAQLEIHARRHKESVE